MAKFAEHQLLQESNRCNTVSLPCFECFQIQQSIGLSVESIDSSHRHFLSRQQPRFLQATFQLHQSRYFQQQPLSGIESISGCTFNFASGLSSSKKMPSSEWKRIQRGVPLFGFILKFGKRFWTDQFIIHLILHLNEFAKRWTLWATIFISHKVHWTKKDIIIVSHAKCPLFMIDSMF